jgi:alpha-amylase/alpha-mannosidase (GH57 family)
VERYVCVHGHFYQPPRENPWLELVERQPAAYPFHDWNERITAECYDPNTRARILDRFGRITQLVNNYARISFNVGPTLLSWMEEAAPTTYAAILAADALSAERFGVGSAMAQVYNHAIMPLAHPRDAATQVRWGVRDFTHRFGRRPDGMWLAETAVDDATLELLAAEGIRFTVLSPYQAGRVRAIGQQHWADASGGRVDPTLPYLVRLPSGASITVFFYDGPLSQGVAFEGLLTDGRRFAERLLHGFNGRPGPQLVNIATDGESYGHHHRHGEMALAAALDHLDSRDDVQLTNYASYLDRYEVTHEAQVLQSSSWSCAHGVERWRSDCGCGGESGLHQRWRAPLRAALDELRVGLETVFEDVGGSVFDDPWAARDDYIDVILDRDDNLGPFLEQHTGQIGTRRQRVRALKLLEMQRHALLMYTSCGWFFDDLARPEPIQVLRYAARAIQLARDVTGVDDLEPRFIAQLAKAEANDTATPDGAAIYAERVRPKTIGLEQVAAHFAIASVSEQYGTSERIGAYEVLRTAEHRERAGRAQLVVGQLTVTSVVTHAEAAFEYAVLHLGDHSFLCGVRVQGDEVGYVGLRDELDRHFQTADFPAVIRAIDHHFEGEPFTLRDLFRDEQQRILDRVLAATMEEVEASYRGIFRGRAPLMRYLSELDTELPAPLRSAAEVVLNAELETQLGMTGPDPGRVESLLEEAARFRVTLDTDGLAHTLSQSVARIARRIQDLLAAGADPMITFEPHHAGTLQRVRDLIDVIELVPFEVDLAPAQDVLWRLVTEHHAALASRARTGDAAAVRWLEELTRAAVALDVAVPIPAPTAPTAPTGEATA